MAPDLEIVPAVDPGYPSPDEQMAAMTARIITEARQELCWRAMVDDIPFRLAEVCDEAAENVHGLLAWWTGRIACMRLEGLL